MAPPTRQVQNRRKREAANQFAAHRLSILKMARELVHVAEACRGRGLHRSPILLPPFIWTHWVGYWALMNWRGEGMASPACGWVD